MIIEANSPQEMSNLNSEKKKGLILIWFYATWCGHCVNMEPEWEKLQENHPPEVNLAKVESEDYNNYEASPNEDKIQGFPTVELYHKNNMVKEYDGERSFQNMYDFIQEYINENPDTKINNLMIIRGKTNKHNNQLLKKLRTNKKIIKLRVPKFKRKRTTRASKSPKSPKSKKRKVRGSKKQKRGRPKGSKNSYPRKRMTKAAKESLSL